MKRTFGLLIFFSACNGLLLLSALPAHAQLDRLYLKADLGGNVTHATELNEFFGESLTPGSKVRFDPGARFGVTAGYELLDWFAVEGELGVMENSIESITDATRVDAWFSRVPFLVNARFQLPNRSPFTPYIGGGLGVSVAILDAEHIDIGATQIRGTSSDAVFAYQAFAGLRYTINDRMGLSVEYRYFAADSPSWEGEFRNDRISFGRTETHAFSFAFDYRF